MAARIMGYAEFERYYEATKKELAYMKPGDTKRIGSSEGSLISGSRKKNERLHEPASSGALVTNQPNHNTRRCECT